MPSLIVIPFKLPPAGDADATVMFPEVDEIDPPLAVKPVPLITNTFPEPLEIVPPPVLIAPVATRVIVPDPVVVRFRVLGASQFMFIPEFVPPVNVSVVVESPEPAGWSSVVNWKPALRENALIRCCGRDRCCTRSEYVAGCHKSKVTIHSRYT